MDHQTFLAQLSATERKSLQRKNNHRALWQLATHASAILVLGVLIHQAVPAWQFLLIPQGVLLVFLFNLQHECTHKTPFSSTTINETVGFVCAAILFQPFLWFRYFHLDHHRYTNDPEKDPELMGPIKPDNWASFLLFLSTIDYWRSKLTLLWSHSFHEVTDSYVPPKARSALKLEARLLVVLYLLLLLFSITISPILLWTWLIPLAIGFPFLKLYHLAEHGLCPMVDDKFQNTRTVLTHRLGRWITWNMPYHAEHHLLPSVPFHQLPKLHKLVHQHLAVTSKGYSEFSQDYLRSLKPNSGR